MLAKRFLIMGFLTLGLFMIFSATPSRAQEGGEEVGAALNGSVIYAQYCGACHGAKGEAIGTNEGFVDITEYDPDFAEGRISNGFDSNRDNNVLMPGYSEEAGGPLTDSEINDVLAYMATWQDPDLDTPTLPTAHLEPGEKEAIASGNAEEGAKVYAYSCYGCHGRTGEGLELENFPAFEVDANTIRVVGTGDGHGYVPAFAETNGGPLSEEELNNLEAYLSTIEVAEEEEGPQGVSILIIVMGLGAVLAVGGAYMASHRFSK
jgi:cytochrome c oxidase cbb3-type subunit III